MREQTVTKGRVVLVWIDDEDFAWEVLEAASESRNVVRAVMVDSDHPGMERFLW